MEAARLRAATPSTSSSRYAWPGNVRELRNVVERLLLLTDDAVDAATGAAGRSTRPSRERAVARERRRELRHARRSRARRSSARWLSRS